MLKIQHTNFNKDFITNTKYFLLRKKRSISNVKDFT